MWRSGMLPPTKALVVHARQQFLAKYKLEKEIAREREEDRKLDPKKDELHKQKMIEAQRKKSLMLDEHTMGLLNARMRISNVFQRVVDSLAVDTNYTILPMGGSFVRILQVQAGVLLKTLLSVDCNHRDHREAIDFVDDNPISVEDLLNELSIDGLYRGIGFHLGHLSKSRNFIQSNISPLDPVLMMTETDAAGMRIRSMRTPQLHATSRRTDAHRSSTEPYFSPIAEETQRGSVANNDSHRTGSHDQLSQQSQILATDASSSCQSSSSSQALVLARESPVGFHPSRQILGQERIISPVIVRPAREVGLTLSNNYEGEVTDFEIANATCPADQNCALWIRGIPADATDRKVLSMIIEGPILSYSRSPPLAGVSEFSAAKIAFKTRGAAVNFMYRAYSVDGIVVNGRRLKVNWNRNHVSPRPDSEFRQTRVLEIVGPADRLDAQTIENDFRKIILFTLIDRDEIFLDNGRKKVVLVFASLRGQCRLAFKAFMEGIKGTKLEGQCSVRYGHDPCVQSVNNTPNSNFTAAGAFRSAASNWRHRG